MMRNRSLLLTVALFLMSAMAGLILFRLYPIMLAVIESLYTTIRGQKLFVGLENYVALFTDSYF